MLTMTEILDKPRAWAVLDANTQVTKDRVYVERIWFRVGTDEDEIVLFDGVGETGKKFNIMVTPDDNTKSLPIELIFHNGLYFKDTDSNANVIISYIPIAD